MAEGVEPDIESERVAMLVDRPLAACETAIGEWGRGVEGACGESCCSQFCRIGVACADVL